MGRLGIPSDGSILAYFHRVLNFHASELAMKTTCEYS